MAAVELIGTSIKLDSLWTKQLAFKYSPPKILIINNIRIRIKLISFYRKFFTFRYYVSNCSWLCIAIITKFTLVFFFSSLISLQFNETIWYTLYILSKFFILWFFNFSSKASCFLKESGSGLFFTFRYYSPF